MILTVEVPIAWTEKEAEQKNVVLDPKALGFLNFSVSKCRCFL